MSVVRSTVLMGVARVVGIFLQLISLRIVLAEVEISGWGNVVYMLTIINLVTLIDLGTPEGFQRQLTKRFDAGEPEAGVQVWMTARKVQWGVALLGAVVIGLLGLVLTRTGRFNPPTYDLIFPLAGLLFSVVYLTNGAQVYLSARRRFDVSAGVNLVLSLGGGILGIVAAFLWPTPEALLLAQILAQILALAVASWSVNKQDHAHRTEVTWSTESLRDALGFGLRNLPNRLGSLIGGSADRIAIQGVLGEAKLGAYGSATRLPDTASGVIPFSVVLMPDLVKAHADGPRPFARFVERSSLAGLLLGMAFVFVPCSFGLVLAPLVLGDVLPPEAGWVCVAMAFFRGVDQFYSVLGMAMGAANLPEKGIPFTIYKGTMTAALSGWAAFNYGIVGVAVMNVCIHVSQFIFLAWVMCRSVAPGIELGQWVAKICALLALSGVLAAGAVIFSQNAWVQDHPWVGLVLALISPIVTLALSDRLGIVHLPESVKAKIDRVIQRVRLGTPS